MQWYLWVCGVALMVVGYAFIKFLTVDRHPNKKITALCGLGIQIFALGVPVTGMGFL